MKPTGTTVSYTNGDSLEVRQSNYENHGPAHTHKYTLSFFRISGERDVLAQHIQAFERTLGSTVIVQDLRTTQINTTAWLLTLERAPNATQWAAFLEKRYVDAVSL